MSNGFSTYASYTELSAINEVESSQTVENLTVTGKLTLANPLSVEDGGTNSVNEEGARQSIGAASQTQVDANFNYVEEETAIGTYFGETLYRQFFSGTTTAAATATDIGTIQNFKQAIKIEGILINSDGDSVSWPYGHAAAAYSDARVLVDGTVQLYTSTTNTTFNLFIYYTKNV